MKKERVLIVEDDFSNAVAALTAFKEEGVDIECVGTYKQFMKKLDTYKPTVVLSDAFIPEDKGKKIRDFSDEISAKCEKKAIPYIFVTGGSPTKKDHSKYEINIIKKEKNGYELLKRYDAPEKEKEMWKDAYELLKKGSVKLKVEKKGS